LCRAAARRDKRNDSYRPDASLLPTRHFNEVWLPQKAHTYFARRDSEALSFVTTLLLPPQ
jgi:hypothetical protein